jgi:hypothetical protein
MVVVKQIIVVVVKQSMLTGCPDQLVETSGTGSNVLQANRARPAFRRQANEQDVIGRVLI